MGQHTDELKHCPFCPDGGEAEVVQSMRSFTCETWEAYFYVRCKECGAMVEGANEAEAIEAWNTRHERTCREVNKYPDGGRCSECGTKIKRAIKNHRAVANYCCYCGARVKEDTDAD